MEWPNELIEVFQDPLLDDVRPKVSAPNASDRIAKAHSELDAWIEQHGREPRRDGDLKEKMMWARLIGINKNK